jgi:hypothetical protein
MYLSIILVVVFLCISISGSLFNDVALQLSIDMKFAFYSFLICDCSTIGSVSGVMPISLLCFFLLVQCELITGAAS